ncbi:MAG: hypothetical protein IPG11_06105 [Flavobacteriales bacterium]|nr:hypothetical protein [Flavobacteriales bacterium]
MHSPLNSLRSILVAGCVLLGVVNAQADHYSGGSITYECTGGNFYDVTLDLYLDCTGAALTAQSLQLSNDCGVLFTVNSLPLVLTEEVSQLCPASAGLSTCNGGTLPGIMHYRFVTTLFLSPCNDWTIAWSICCRSSTENVQGTPGMYLETTLNNAGGVCDASPIIGDNSIPFVCVNDPVLYNPGITDPDGNTMAFELISAQFAAPAPTNVTYQGGGTAIAPIPGITLDPANGQMIFTPTVTGNYVVVVEVTTYDVNGLPIGTIMRDFIFVVVNCMGDPPISTGLTNTTTGFITGSGSIEVCDGLPFCADIPFTDADVGGSVTLTSNITTLLPGATFTVTGTNPAVGQFCWTPDPAFSPVNILITATDNACPIPNVATFSVLITVVDPPPVPPDAGTNGSVVSCTGGPAINLFNSLGGSPDVGGVWTDPNGAVHNGSFTPSTDLFGLYVYRVGNGCQTAQATVNVTANGGSPGTNGTLDICATGATVALINSLGGSPQAGGSWAGPSPVVGGNYNPTNMLPGVYTYTVLGVPPCPNASATVTVNESAGPNAGGDGPLSVCSNGASVALSTGLGGAPQAGGTWAGPSPVVGGNYDPATMTPGAYVYTVTGVAPCANATATVTVTENTATNAGTNGPLTLCSNGASVALSTGLGGAPQAGGTWAGPSPVVGGNYDPATMTPGAYVYTVTGVAPCANATATVTVTENAATNAGTNGPLTLCSNGASVALSTGLGGAPQAGGTWAGPSPVVGGNYDPATMTPGAYVYTVTGVAPCANATATVTVTENTATNAGTNGPLTLCSNGASVALSTGLGGAPQAGGTWAGPSPVVGGNYDPATMTPGAYVYTVTGVAPCANATATVTVTENTATNAGTNGPLTLCSNGASVALSTGLGGAPQAGGTWAGPSPVVGGNYDPATMTPGAYVYTVTGVAPCANATATVTVTENAATNAGTDGTLTVCSSGASGRSLDRSGRSTTSRRNMGGPSPVVGGNYDPATMTPGAYVYTVTGVAPCANATATVTVTENTATNAGTNGPLTLCSNGASVALSTGLGGAPQAGGTWAGPSPVVGGNYDPATMTPGAYVYTVTGVAPCANATATVTVTENTATNAGTNGPLTLCSNGASVALSTGLGGAPQAGGTWAGPSPVVGGNYDPATMTPGAYVYTVTGVAPCANATATVTVTENTATNAGTNGPLTLCSNGASVALSTGLGGAPQAGGTWSGPSPVVGGNYDPGDNDTGCVRVHGHRCSTLCERNGHGNGHGEHSHERRHQRTADIV